MAHSDQDAVVVVDTDDNEARRGLLTQLLVGGGAYAARRRLFPPRPRVRFVDAPAGGAADEAPAAAGAATVYDGMDEVVRAAGAGAGPGPVAVRCVVPRAARPAAAHGGPAARGGLTRSPPRRPGGRRAGGDAGCRRGRPRPSRTRAATSARTRRASCGGS